MRSFTVEAGPHVFALADGNVAIRTQDPNTRPYEERCVVLKPGELKEILERLRAGEGDKGFVVGGVGVDSMLRYGEPWVQINAGCLDYVVQFPRKVVGACLKLGWES